MRRSWSKFLVISAIAAASLVAAAPASAGPPWALIYPTSGTVTGLVGDCRDGCSRLHAGIDIGNARYTDIVASYAGTAFVHPDSGSNAGSWIEVVHPNGYSTRYLHLQSFLVGNGQQVRKGQHIAEMGNTGDPGIGVHLHYEVRHGQAGSQYPNNTRVDINPGFPPRNGSVSAKAAMPMDFYLAASDIAPFTNELAFVGTQHTDFYGRGVTSGEAVLWIDALWNGMSGTDMANRILRSAEADQELLGVVRLYYTAFDRHPDAGARTWLNKSLSTVATGFLNSSEGKAKLSTNPEAYVRKLYTNGLNRTASASEVSYWAGQVRSRGRAWVMVAISESAEHRGIRRGQAPTQGAYLAMLRRPADSGALNYWAPILRDTPAASAYLVHNIRLSAEYNRRIP